MPKHILTCSNKYTPLYWLTSPSSSLCLLCICISLTHTLPIIFTLSVQSSWSSSHCLTRFYSGRLILNFHVTLDSENYFGLPLARDPHATSWGVTFDSQSAELTSWQGSWHVGHIRLLISCICWFLVSVVCPLHVWFFLIFLPISNIGVFAHFVWHLKIMKERMQLPFLV
jgi:hypothetical protein